jgi:hypothetical protein
LATTTAAGRTGGESETEKLSTLGKKQRSRAHHRFDPGLKPRLEKKGDEMMQCMIAVRLRGKGRVRTNNSEKRKKKNPLLRHLNTLANPSLETAGCKGKSGQYNSKHET